MENKKHWRDVYDSEYLASWDLDKSVVLTIDRCVEEVAKLAKKEKKVIAYFKEQITPSGVKVKPFIVNPSNCKFIQSRSGIQYFSDWKDLKIEISVTANTSKVGSENKLIVSNVLLQKEVDISHILESKDLVYSRDEANKVLRLLSQEQKDKIRNHLAILENV